MLAPAIMHNDVMQKFGLDLPQYRELMARFEHFGIVRAIAIGARNGHLQVDGVVVEIVRQLNDAAKQPKPKPDRWEQVKRYFFGKWWFVGVMIAIAILGAVAGVVSYFKTIIEWFHGRP